MRRIPGRSSHRTGPWRCWWAVLGLTLPLPLRSDIRLPEGFASETVAANFSGATGMAVAPDGRIFICEQTGALRVVRDGKLSTEPVLTVNTDMFWERGLIGVALARDFAKEPWIYVHDVPGQPFPHHRISRFRLHAGRALPESRQILFEGGDETRSGGHQPAGHQGGGLAFGPDGMLYFGLGEQTAEKPAQDKRSLLGKILRIQPGGGIPDDNPFVNELEGPERAIWALGLRNPFAIAFDPASGRMFINDVGPERPEEINEGRPGANYGWPAVRGVARDARFDDPLFTYEPKDGKCIAGGAFYAGCQPQFPGEWRGKYFFLEYMLGWLGAIDPDHPGVLKKFATGFQMPVSVAVEPDGSLLVLERAAWVKDRNWKPETGRLLRIRYRGE